MSDRNLSEFGELFPQINELNAPFWNGLAQGEVRMQQCGACSAHQYPAETFCYECGAGAMSWVPVAGEGTLYSFTVVHQLYHKAFKPFLPYTVAIVQTDEGPRMLAPMLGLKRPLTIGERVKPCIRIVDNDKAFLTYVPVKE
ncbi:MAG TPA: OB-fold domain-containing protein [Burkholderiales bacterium]|nr:OB-fold domain-containing protein [Burkholderiales bacterium]